MSKKCPTMPEQLDEKDKNNVSLATLDIKEDLEMLYKYLDDENNNIHDALRLINLLIEKIEKKYGV